MVLTKIQVRVREIHHAQHTRYSKEVPAAIKHQVKVRNQKPPSRDPQAAIQLFLFLALSHHRMVYFGPPPPSGGTQVMLPKGSRMSQVLQCTQFEAFSLIGPFQPSPGVFSFS